MNNQGKVWLLGAGPGDPGLMTIKGRQVLDRAEVVVYDALLGQGVLAMIPPKAKAICVGKRFGESSTTQEEINRILLEEAERGNRVVRLKGGDPFLFGRGGEEAELLAERGIPFEVVPGVSSAVAVPAYAGIPVTHRNFSSSLHIITAHGKHGDTGDCKNGEKMNLPFKALSELSGTLVFLMGAAALEEICTGLMKAGMARDTPAAFLENGTTARQRKAVSTLAWLPMKAREAGLKAPAVIVVGEVCALAEKLSWEEKRPLGGARIIVTRPAQSASTLCEKLSELGAEVVAIPAISTKPFKKNPALDLAIASISIYRWLAFTSPTGVEYFFQRLLKNRLDVRCLAHLKVAAIGSGTAKSLAKHGILADLVPKIYCGRELGKALSAAILPNEKLLLPRAENGSRELTAELDLAGVAYDDIATYFTVTASSERLRFNEWLGISDHLDMHEHLKLHKQLGLHGLAQRGGADFVAFTSASTVRGFVAGLAESGTSIQQLGGIRAVCIGEQTAAEARKLCCPCEVAEVATIDSLVEKILEIYK